MTKQRTIRTLLVIAALVLTAPFAISIASLCGLAALAGLRSISVAVPLPWIMSFDGPHTAVARLFADPTRYVVSSFLALLLLAGGLIDLGVRSRRGLISRPQFYLFVLGIGCVVGFAWLHPYEPAVRATPDARLEMVEPPGRLMGVVRRNWVSAEIESCAFEVLGWADANTLVYRQWCGGFFDPHNLYAWKDGTPAPPRAYHVDAKTGTLYTGDVKSLSRDTCPYWSCVRPLLEKDYVHTYSLSSSYPGATDASVRSPGGKWAAFRAKHVYGPEDLLIIGPSKEN